MKPSTLRIPALCLGLLVLSACGKSKDQQGPPQMPPPEVGVITLQPQNAPLTKDLVGRLSPYRSADVRARVPGVLLKRTYEEGTDVKKGQVLFQIDPAPLKAVLGASQASVAQAQASYANAKANAQRARELAPKGYISKSDLDNALATERTTAAQMQAARANVQSAQINLGYANVTSPIDGRAGKQQVTEGALVGNGDATLLTTVDQIDPLYVNFSMSVSELGQMRAAQSSGDVTLAEPGKASVAITLPDGRTYDHAGTLDFSSTVVNPSTGGVDLRAQVPNPERTLLPGMYVTLEAKLGEQHKVFLVPEPAVLRDTAGAYVMTVGADGKVARQNVTTADVRDGMWVITGGVKAGDQVVVSGIQKVKEGAPAKATPWQRPPAGSASSPSSPSSPAPAAAGGKHA
jgi:membrane fusion protein (multidrug efflux system)